MPQPISMGPELEPSNVETPKALRVEFSHTECLAKNPDNQIVLYYPINEGAYIPMFAPRCVACMCDFETGARQVVSVR
jgi:hypothetical protein